MNPRPEMPQPKIQLRKEISLPSNPSVRDILEAAEMICRTYPNAKHWEMMLESTGGMRYYYDRDHSLNGDSYPDSDDGYELVFNRWEDNPSYEEQLKTYQADLIAWNKAEHEERIQRDASYRCYIEQQNARKEYKQQRHQERYQERLKKFMSD